MADLDFLDTIRLINFLRSEAREGRIHRTVPSRETFQQDVYLQPALPDDPLLYSLGDLPHFAEKDELPIAEARLEHGHKIEVEALALKGARMAAVQEMLNSIKVGQSDEEVPLGKLPTSRAEENDSSYFESYSYNGESPLSRRC